MAVETRSADQRPRMAGDPMALVKTAIRILLRGLRWNAATHMIHHSMDVIRRRHHRICSREDLSTDKPSHSHNLPRTSWAVPSISTSTSALVKNRHHRQMATTRTAIRNHPRISKGMLRMNQFNGQCPMFPHRLTRVKLDISRPQSITIINHSARRTYRHVHRRLKVHVLKLCIKLRCRCRNLSLRQFMTIIPTRHQSRSHERRTAGLLVLVIYMMTMARSLHLLPSLYSADLQTVKKRSKPICRTSTVLRQRKHPIYRNAYKQMAQQYRPCRQPQYHVPYHFRRAYHNLLPCQT